MRPERFLAGLLCFSAFVLSFCLAFPALTYAAQVSGKVFDSEKSTPVPIEDAVVTITGTSLNLSAMTNPLGDYSFEDIPSGSYVMNATKDGFRALAQKSVELGVTPMIVNFALSPFHTGDISDDGSVDGVDLLILLEHYPSKLTEPNTRYLPEADLNYDRLIDHRDLFEFARRWYRSPVPNWIHYTPTPTSLATDTPTITQTPEFTVIPTETDIPTATETPEFTATPIDTDTPVATPEFTMTPTETPTFTDTPVFTFTPTNTDTPVPTETVFIAPRFLLP